MTSFQTSGTAHSGYVYCFIYKYMGVCVCIRNSHIDSRPVEHQLSNFIVIYTCIVYGPEHIIAVICPGSHGGKYLLADFQKGSRPQTESPPFESLPRTALSSPSSSQVDDLKQTMGKPRRCSRYIIYIYLSDYNARRMTVSNKHTYII